jgi:hypothetical protein
VTGRNSKAERAYQNTVDEALRMFGCVTKHDYPLLTRHMTWRTGTTLPGWPDLFAFHPRRWLLFVEVKVPPNGLEDEQLACLSLAAAVPCARVWVVTPDDPPWPVLQGWMREPKSAPAVHGFEPHPDPRRLLAEAERRRAQRRADRTAAKLARTPSRRGSPGRTPDTLPGL